MGVGSSAYKVLLVAHVLLAIVGFGAIFLNAAYARQGRRRGGLPALAVAEANGMISTTWGLRCAWAVPIFGLALVGMSRRLYSLSQAWLWVSLAIYAVSMAVWLFLVAPAERNVRGLLGRLSASGGGCGGCPGAGSPGCGSTSTHDPEVGEEERAEMARHVATLQTRIAMYGGIVNLGVVAVLALMVFKPGLPGA